jgi:hypothetical protein
VVDDSTVVVDDSTAVDDDESGEVVEVACADAAPAVIRADAVNRAASSRARIGAAYADDATEIVVVSPLVRRG